MNLPFFIARRYLISKKSRNVINLISGVSIAGITIGTLALILVLSIFNGLESLIKSLFSSFDPELKITLVEGKTFSTDLQELQELKNHPSVAVYTEVLEENALVKYRERQALITLKGVSDNYDLLTGIDSLIVDGEFQLWDNQIPTGIVGYELAHQLGVGVTFFDPLNIYVPKKSSGLIINPASAFSQDYVFPRGTFSVQQEYDSKYIIVPLSFASKLLRLKDKASSIELKVNPEWDLEDAKDELSNLLGTTFKVEDRSDQHAAFYKVMASEKWAIFLILGFILIIASFNTISSLTLLILEKKSDMHILQAMGITPKEIRRIFLFEGLLIGAVGAAVGLALGFILGWVQIQFGIIRFPNSGSFIVEAYPLKMIFSDFVWVTLLVGTIAWFAAFLPVRILGGRYFSSFDGSSLKS